MKKQEEHCAALWWHPVAGQMAGKRQHGGRASDGRLQEVGFAHDIRVLIHEVSFRDEGNAEQAPRALPDRGGDTRRSEGGGPSWATV